MLIIPRPFLEPLVSPPLSRGPPAPGFLSEELPLLSPLPAHLAPSQINQSVCRFPAFYFYQPRKEHTGLP